MARKLYQSRMDQQRSREFEAASPKRRNPLVLSDESGDNFGTEKDGSAFVSRKEGRESFGPASRLKADELADEIAKGKQTCKDVSRGVGRFNFHMRAQHLICRAEVKDILRRSEKFSQLGMCSAAGKELKKAKTLAKSDGCGPGPKADELVEKKMKSQGLMGLRRRRSHRSR